MKYEESDSLFINFFRVISFLFSFFDTFFFFLIVGDGGGGGSCLSLLLHTSLSLCALTVLLTFVLLLSCQVFGRKGVVSFTNNFTEFLAFVDKTLSL